MVPPIGKINQLFVQPVDQKVLQRLKASALLNAFGIKQKRRKNEPD